MSSALLGLPYPRALALAREAGAFPVRLTLTVPPRAQVGQGSLRLIAVRGEPGRPEWVIACESVQRLSRSREEDLR